MSFYESISAYYQDIFPLKPMQVRYVKDSFTDLQARSLLDVGCGTGDLTLALSGFFGHLAGIDLDSAMLKQAGKSPRANAEFRLLNMLDIQKQFGEAVFDGVVCFGNTLVHLEDLNAISDFIQQTHKVLRKGGKLLLQIINYDRILDAKIRSLPTIETGRFSFVRNYSYINDLHLINFETLLTIKSNGQILRNEIRLYPLRRAELETVLNKAGFSTISWYGDFQRSPLDQASIPMVIEACP